MLPIITTQQIHIFLTVTDMGGFAKAAPVLHMTQSSVSKAIMRLEKLLGFSLFERTTRTFSLTANGKELYDLWSTHLKELGDVLGRIAAHEQMKQNSIKIGVINTIRLENFLWDILEKFERKYPNVVVNIESESLTEIVPKFLMHEFDIIFVPEFARYALDKAGMPRKCAAKDYAQLIVSNSHPLAQKDAVYMAELCQESFVGFDNTFSDDFYKYFSEIFAETGQIPNFVKRYKSESTVRTVHRTKDVLILTDNYFVYDLLNDAKKIPVLDFMPGIICSWHKDEHGGMIEKLIEII